MPAYDAIVQQALLMAFGDFTIIDVMRALHIRADKHTTWPVGREVRKHFKDKYGRDPPHKLRDKTSGRGPKHCFCTYPKWFWPEVVQIWLSYAKPSSPGLFLFP